MGTLKGMLDFLKGAQDNLGEIQKKLDDIQTYFNNNFSNVNEVRNSEIEMLQEAFFKDAKEFPGKISSIFKEKVKTETKTFEVSVRDGFLDLEFAAFRRSPKISALEVLRMGAAKTDHGDGPQGTRTD